MRFKCDKHQKDADKHTSIKIYWTEKWWQFLMFTMNMIFIFHFIVLWSNKGIVWERKSSYQTKGSGNGKHTQKRYSKYARWSCYLNIIRLVTNLIGFSMFLIINKRLPVHVFIPYIFCLSLSHFNSLQTEWKPNILIIQWLFIMIFAFVLLFILWYQSLHCFFFHSFVFIL